MDNWADIFLLFSSNLNKVKQVRRSDVLPFLKHVLEKDNFLMNIGANSA